MILLIKFLINLRVFNLKTILGHSKGSLMILIVIETCNQLTNSILLRNHYLDKIQLMLSYKNSKANQIVLSINSSSKLDLLIPIRINILHILINTLTIIVNKINIEQCKAHKMMKLMIYLKNII